MRYQNISDLEVTNTNNWMDRVQISSGAKVSCLDTVFILRSCCLVNFGLIVIPKSS